MRSMNLLVTFDSEGNILAIAPLPPQPARGRLPTPRLLEGQFATELEVPEEHTRLGLLDLHKQFRVDNKGEKPRLVAKG